MTETATAAQEIVKSAAFTRKHADCCDDCTDRARRAEINDYMCPNCQTPWKCNGPHIPPRRRPFRG